jgi:RNA polymerase sigma factor (TIGR02999 family)
MRRILIDRARDRKRLKRGGRRVRHDLDIEAIAGESASPDDLLDLDAALDHLAVIDSQAASLVKLRLFAGLAVQEAAAALCVSRRTAERDWTFARTWLYGQLRSRAGAE